jgi:hypothetical protein
MGDWVIHNDHYCDLTHNQIAGKEQQNETVSKLKIFHFNESELKGKKNYQKE